MFKPVIFSYRATNGKPRGLNGTISAFVGDITDSAEIMPDQKIAVITGSSSGIGLLTAIEFAQNGYQVVATLRDSRWDTQIQFAKRSAPIDCGLG